MIIVTNILNNKSKKYFNLSIEEAIVEGYYELNQKIKRDNSDLDMLKSIVIKTDYYCTLFNCFAIDVNNYNVK